MNGKWSRNCAKYVVFASVAGLAGSLLIASSSAFAQEKEEVTIVAPREMVKTVGRGMTGAPIREVSLTFAVSLADLDLTRAADYAEAEKRINETAAEACKQLDRMYPLMEPDPVCAKKTADGGQAELKTIVAAGL